jgi:Icc-related predicted phosphoesterase|tara:strand:+ start:1397 stop:2266 length:870 start_codon:yes stop_codon:yes gene_type:complete
MILGPKREAITPEGMAFFQVTRPDKSSKSRMKIVAASDLHLEFSNADWSQALAFPEDTDVIVLAGDIGVGSLTIEVVLSLSAKYPSSHIVWVAGNHEFYNQNIDSKIEKYRAACAENPRIHFLENDSVEINSVKFIGCTLWSDFSILGDSESAIYASRSVNDFVLIRTRNDEMFTPQDAITRFNESSAFLKEALSNGDPKSTVVVTHFPPGIDTHNTNFEVDSITAYFQANVEHLIHQYQPSLWIYGHNHYSNDLTIGQTRVISNQLGYPSERGYIPDYNPTNTIELEP